MKIEFKKVPQNEKLFDLKLDSVKFSGTFCKISSKLAKINGNIEGVFKTTCSKCGDICEINLQEKQIYIISDGPISTQDERENELIIEIDNNMIEFDEILKSEIESMNSDIHICNECEKKNSFIDVEL